MIKFKEERRSEIFFFPQTYQQIVFIRNKKLNFIWKGKDKIKRLTLINEIEYGGFKDA